MQRNILSSTVKLAISVLSRFTSRLKAEQLLPLISLVWNQVWMALLIPTWEESFISMAWNDTKRCGHLCPGAAELLLALQRCLCSFTLFSLSDTRFSYCYWDHAQSLWRAEHAVLKARLSSFLWKIRLAKKSLFVFVLVEIRAEPGQSRSICVCTHLAVRTPRNGAERSSCKRPSPGSGRFSSGTWV